MLARLPLLPAATVATLVALGWLGAPAVVPFVALGCGATAALLAVLSVDRPRRLGWGAAVAVSLAALVRLLLPAAPALGGDALAGLRGTLGAPLLRLVPAPESGIVLGVALGDRAGLDPDLGAAFARSGTSHLLAISGFNMTLVAAAIAAALRGRSGPRVRAVVTILSVGAYSVLVGLGGSVIRSAVMAGLGALGVALGRRAAAANGLCAAIAGLLLVDPAAIADPGFLLSATATAGLLAFQAPLAARLAWLPALVGDGLATTLAATLPTLPLVAGLFGQISLIAPLANVLAVPLFPALMATSVATVSAGAIALDLARPFALATYAVAFAVRVIVETSAALPLAALAVPPGAGTGLSLALATAVALFVARRLRPRSWPGAALAARARASASRRVRAVGRRVARPAGALATAPGRPSRAVAIGLALVLAGSAVIAIMAIAVPPAFRVRALDVGQGDAYLVEAGGRIALIDGGPDPARLLAELGASLPAWQRRIDLVVLTHAHTDHGAGLLAVLARYEVGLAVAPRGLNPGPLADAWEAALAAHRIAHAALAAGAQLRLGPARLRVLAPNEDPAVDVPSLVLRLELGGASALFSGDATEAAQADLLLAPDALRARLYVPPHHGAATPYAAALVSAVRPEVALISAGRGNRYGHPTAETLSALAAVATYRTDRDGTIAVRADGPRLAVETHANGLGPPRPQGIPRLGR